MSNGIVERENSHENLLRLASQRQLYSKGKIILGAHVIALIVFSILSLLNIIYVNFCPAKGTSGPASFSWLIVSISAIISFADIFIISKLIYELKEKAAKIQEEFDTAVLSIPWNSILCGEKPMREDIILNAENYKMDDLTDWYSVNVKEVPLPAARILCQRSNLCWDSALRKKYLDNLKVIIGLICLALLFLGLIVNPSAQSIALNIVAPLIALLLFLSKQVIEHTKSIDNNNKLKSNLDSCWSTVLKDKEPTGLEDKARKIQDIIFNSRKSNALVFDFIYDKYRDRQERAMSYSVKSLVEEYQISHGK